MKKVYAAMLRLSASRLLRWLVVAAALYMIVNFAARYFFAVREGPRDIVGGGRDMHETTLSKDMPLGEKQAIVDYMGASLVIRYQVVNNLIEDYKFIGRITLKNGGARRISAGPWSVYFFHHGLLAAPQSLQPEGAELANRMLRIAHINGGMFRLWPTALFAPLEPGDTLRVPFEASRWVCSRTGVYPNWYVGAPGARSAVLASTRGESLAFVAPFDKGATWKRNAKDNHNPLTPSERYRRNELQDRGGADGRILPTPLQVTAPSDSGSVTVDFDTWVVVGNDKMQNEATYLEEKTGMKGVHFAPKTKFISLSSGDVSLPSKELVKEEACMLTVDHHTESVAIVGPTPAGVFYCVQTLLSLLDASRTLMDMRIVDAPRFSYRGVMVDVARNFISREKLLQLIDVMASYKLNKLHLHLTDDEGWRLEIPELPELTTVGGRRCADLSEESCLLPFLGADPSGKGSGSGFFSVNDYRALLRHAQARQVQVIPEVDLPGHSHAAIRAMKVRYERLLLVGRASEAAAYLLSDPADKSSYRSVQQFTDNVVNVCQESTYAFIERVFSSIAAAHADVAPLHTLHVGGDEVPAAALLESPVCVNFMRRHGYQQQADLLRYFGRRLLQIAGQHQVRVQGWEEIFYRSQRLLPREQVAGEVLVNAWQNVWTGLSIHRAHDLANHNYKVVLGPATHLYLDHPHEPDPEEHGLFWATRFTDTFKVFGFMPDNMYDNIDISLFGQPLTKQAVCRDDPARCPKLLKPENIIGLEGHLWGETIRTPDHVDEMLFPRIIALAERAWHRADWEAEPDVNKRQRKKNDAWGEFANTLGYHELRRLEARGINYHLPVPGAVIKDGQFKVNAAIPGLPFIASSDNGVTWVKLDSRILISGQVLLATRNITEECCFIPARTMESAEVEVYLWSLGVNMIRGFVLLRERGLPAIIALD